MVRLIEKLDFPDSKFTLYFLGYHQAKDIPEDRKERVRKFAALSQLVKAIYHVNITFRETSPS